MPRIVESRRTTKDQLVHAALANDLHGARKLVGKCNVNCRHQAEDTPLHSAAIGGYAQMVALLLEFGADANATNVWGYTPIHYACGKGSIAVARLLLDHGADRP
jgi:ankyrin repeat protein|tara:strand:+ start:531 stop:842 length:312 start_codon:yes stop_codon:yes gene_type:complete